jgi:alkylation response protein AidB-like acyl-CoA dehydrogenase
MNFNFSKEESLLQKSVREYIRDKILPIADAGDRKAPMPKNEVHPVLEGLFPFGYIGSLAPLDAGGPDLSHVEAGIIFSELGKAWAALGAVVFSTSMVISRVLKSQNENLIRRYLPPLLQGKMIGAFAVTEPMAGTDASGIQTTADLAGDHFVVNGEKVWVSNGMPADMILVAAIIQGTDGGQDAIGQDAIGQNTIGQNTIGLILVEKAVSSYSAAEMPKMGLKGLSSAKLLFNGCRVPKENFLGPLGQQALPGSFLSDAGKCQIAAIAIGLAEAALDASITYARQRVQFGKVLGEFHMIQKMIADMATGIDAARLLCFRALKMLDEGAACRKEVEIAKAFSVDMAVEAASKAIQIHGAYGYADEFPMERFYRDACCLALMDGDPDLARMTVARHIMGILAKN